MSLLRSRALRATAVTTALSAALLTGIVTLPAAQAAPAADPAGPASTIGKRLLTAQFDAQSRTIERGAAFKVTGTISKVTQATVGRPDDGVPASFTLAVTDADGNVLGTQDITAAKDGSFSTMVPGSVTRKLPTSDAALSLGLRALDASYDDYAADDAGAGSVTVAAAATDLTIENSFVSSVGWVKPDETYPSRIIVTNPTAAPVAGTTVTTTAPRGTDFTGANGPGTSTVTPDQVSWTLPTVDPGQRVTLVLEHRADSLGEEATLVWRDLSTTAVLDPAVGADQTVSSHGPKVIPPSEIYDTARYGDRPFPVVPVNYLDLAYTDHDRTLDQVINDPATPGSTFNLFQEMSLGQLFPEGTVPSDGIPTKDFAYEPGFEFTNAQPGQSCHGTTVADSPAPAEGSPLYPERITNGVYNLPGQTEYYGSDANGSAVIGAVGGVGALQQIDSGCGPTGKLVYDAAALADPEIDYSDYDTDKDGIVDFFMVVFAGCGGNGSSQLSVAGCDIEGPYGPAPYDNVWPHSSSLEYYYTDEASGLPGFTTDDQLKDLEGRPLWYTNDSRSDMTTTPGPANLKVLVRVGPYNVNPETAIDKASVISHEYGHSLGLPDFYSTGSRETYGDWNLMATDKSQNMDAFSRQELGWVVPEVLEAGESRTVNGFKDSKEDNGVIRWQQADGTPYTLTDGPDGTVHNSEMYVAKLPGRQLFDPAKFDTGEKATKTHAWWSTSGNDFGCAPEAGRNFDLSIPGLAQLPAGSTVDLSFKSLWDIEWDYDYGYVLTTVDGGKNYTSNPSENGYTTSNTDPTAGNPNQNGCQTKYDNGLTGTSGSYEAGTESSDRKLGEYPEAVFLSDSYDISELAGKTQGALRFSYATDPGLARPGWFIDDVKVTATTPTGEQVLLETDFEGEGGPDDERVFNGGCREDLSTAQACTKGWRFLQAGAASEQDHAYYLEMRDRSGFDLDGNGEIDRDPIAFQAGLSLVYTDEAHGYGNAGTDDPPAQSPLDSVPEPGSNTPDLSDAAFTAAPARSSFSDKGEGHTDNYEDPANSKVDSRYADVPNPWRFQYDCLGFKVNSMSGNADGPATSNGDLTGKVTFTMGTGCGEFNYGYTSDDPTVNTAPSADAKATPGTARPGQRIEFDAGGSVDTETPDDLDFSWDFGNGGSTKDGTGEVVKHKYDQPGTYTATVTVTDPEGQIDTASVDVTVTGQGGDTTDPKAKLSISPGNPFHTQKVSLSGKGSRDDESSSKQLSYTWNFGDGGAKVDATGKNVKTKFRKPGFRTVRLTVTDQAGNSSTAKERILVRRYVACQNQRVTLDGSWRTTRGGGARGGSYCDNQGRGPGKDVVTYSFKGPRLLVLHGESARGGVAKVIIDGKRRANLSFRNQQQQVRIDDKRLFRGLGSGEHTVRIVVQRGEAYLEGFIVRR